MKTLAELKKRLAALKAEGRGIVEAAEVSEDAVLSEAQEERFAAIEEEIAQVQAQITEKEKLNERRRRMQADGEGTQTGGGTGSGTGGRNAVHDSDPRQTAGFRDIGEFAVAVHGAVNASRYGGEVDHRLAALTGSHEGGGAEGEGYSLPPQFRDNIWELMTEFDEFGPLIDEEPTSSREVKLMHDETTPWGTSGIKAYWRKEGSKMTPTELDDEGRNVPLHELYTLALASEELLEDAPRLNNRLSRKAAQAIAWKKNLAIVEGNGVGQPLGWMKSTALITVGKEAGQAADTISALNVIKMYSRLLMVPGDEPFWQANSDTLPQLMTMTVGDKPIWMPPNGLANAPGGFLLGKPVRLTEYAKTVGDLGDLQLISPKGYYAARRSSGVKFASSIHLYFDYNTMAFRWVFRYGGQPHLKKPVSPANGPTKSHFVALAERA
ncbi:phage major capsid protein [Arenibacterium halophilum]|uniref:Phage major capsid protein n=1 Tax=Arenibacterium halophilum TaxID=2583821 RepID=A0ABY2WWY7_9RHOB|nr:phage major capsid protein [Arenibacterium halophilum]TMV07311.1 phage major capsid protein [Arenibacterium halophilum]